MALQDSYQQVHADTRRSRSEIPSKGKLSRRSSVQAAGAQAFCLGVLALILTLPCNCGVGAITFAISGFSETDVYIVGDSSWIFNSDSRCFSYGGISDAGRFLHPSAVQMKDPGATAVKSFSTSFIYQMRASFPGINGPGLAFIIVPDNVTIGGSAGYMGVITTDTSDTTKNYESDNYTFAVELDTHNDTMFDDPNDNHIGVNLASMISSHLIKPDFILASESTVQYQQIWIEYTGATSTMDIYSGYYGQDKPDKPQGSQLLVDLSYLKESMYIGFSTGTYIDDPAVYAWSFSNDGVPAPPIYIGQAAPLAAPSPPPDISYPLPPSPGPQAPLPGLPKAPPPSSPAPPTPSPIPPTPSPLPPTPSPSSSPPEPVISAPPFNLPPSSPSIDHRTGPSAAHSKKEIETIVGICLGIVGLVLAVFISGLYCWKVYHRTLHFFISHAGGENGEGKNFPTWLHQALTTEDWSTSKMRVKFFFDVVHIPKGKRFGPRIFQELKRFDVGVVVVTPDFFIKKWPMTELIAFMDAVERDRQDRKRVLPLFYRLKVAQVRVHLKDRTWEGEWIKWSQGDHPIAMEKCTQAVKWLCDHEGIPYVAQNDQDQYDRTYITLILMEVKKILCQERELASGRRWALPCCCTSTRDGPV